MNTTQLKSFAQQARLKLMEQVAAKLHYVLNEDSAAIRGKEKEIKKIKTELNEIGEQALIEKVAYTWFNRLVAIRFMDANGFQPFNVSIISPVEGSQSSLAEVIELIQGGNIPEELNLDRGLINDLLDGKAVSNNPNNEIMRMVLVEACNYYHSLFPFLFEKINDYTELLLPDDLVSPISILADVVKGMSKEDCTEVEIIGWLYQFYVSERNEELISSKKVYMKDELAPASQLFTPKWIVQYMVDNTLGQLLMEHFPNSKIYESLEYYIKPDYTNSIPTRESKKLEEIKFFEPCVGSGHILSYAFDVFYLIYEEQGYTSNEIPQLIIENNLFGVDIDPRAAQMASFVLMMKGRLKQRRFFRTVEKSNLKPNIYFYQDFSDDDKFKHATSFGSLIKIDPVEAENFVVETGTIFENEQSKLKQLYTLLSRRYDVVVTNPPYISSSRMEPGLKKYVETNWPTTKSDLFATFILRCLELTNKDGFTGYMTPFVWMFISSYEKLREELIDNHLIHSLIQLEYSGFDGATVPICTFTLRNNYIEEAKGSYIRLSDFKGSANQAPKTLEAIENPNCGWFYTANQKDFEKIPGNNIGYWLSVNTISTFGSDLLKNNLTSLQGIITGDTLKFLRYWNEVNFDKLLLNSESFEVNKKWISYTKGGSFRKWFGNNEYVISWINNGQDLVRNRSTNSNYYLKPCITWTLITSSTFSARYCDKGFLWDVAGSIGFPINEVNMNYILGVLSSKMANFYLKILNPTINTNIENIESIPFIKELSKFNNINEIVNELIRLSKEDWDCSETSWDFNLNELVRLSSSNLSSAIESYKAYWKEQFFRLHQNEEELNRQFIEIYGLHDELTPDVPLEDITILKDETEIVNGELVFKEKEIIAQFISYAVGCVFGRYSLDKEGLILANQGETFKDYLAKVGKTKEQLQFVPDEDNIVPLLEEEWFYDDMVTRVKDFVKAVWGEASYSENIAYIENTLGKDLRKYLVKDFYKDHIKRYKKRPIYWQFSSPKGAFNVLIYMHRYSKDTLSEILNGYLREFIGKLENHIKHLETVVVTGSAAEQAKARKEIDKLKNQIDECRAYEVELYKLAAERIEIDLDEGVLVNYNKFGNVIAPVAGLNDKKAKDKVKKFDWIDTTQIR